MQDNRPPPKDFKHHLSRITRARQPSSIKAFYKYFQIPGIGQLAGGLPNNNYFPFDTLEAKVARPDRWEPTSNRPVEPPSEESLAALSIDDVPPHTTNGPYNKPQDNLVIPHTSKQINPTKKIDLDTALQYGQASGFAPLQYFVREFTRNNLHPNCPYKGGPEVILSCGNTDGFSKVMQAFTNEWSEEKDWIRDRECILVEQFSFGLALGNAQPRGVNVAPVAMDEEGMLAEGPGALRDVLEKWDHNKGKRPHLMYTITMGQNPTSGVLSLQRRREIYDICREYDILIIEDDPYWYLQYPSATAKNTTTTSDPANVSFNPDVEMFANGEPRPESWKSSGYKFLDSLAPSYINMDVDGRVIRLDTFSKTVAPGCRLGWITAQPALIDKLFLISEGTTQAPSGFVQAMLAELILGPDHSGFEKAKGGKGPLPDGEGWKADGWVRWLEGLRGNYERRMNQTASILDEGKYLVKSGRRGSLADEEDEWSVVEKTQLYEFSWPAGGMFLWMKVLFESHPLYSTYKKIDGGLERLSHAQWIFWTTEPHRVLVAPGSMFSPTPSIAQKEGWKYFRLCFAAINKEELGPVAHRLAEGTAAFFRIKDKKVIEKILQEDEDEEAIMTKPGLAQLAMMTGGC